MHFNKRLIVLLSILLVVIIAAAGTSVYLGAHQAQVPTTTQGSQLNIKEKFIGTWQAQIPGENTLAPTDEYYTFRADGTYQWTEEGVTEVCKPAIYWTGDRNATTTGTWRLASNAGAIQGGNLETSDQYYLREEHSVCGSSIVAADFSNNENTLDLYSDGGEHTSLKKVQ